MADVLTATQRRLVVAILKDRFPLLATDQEIDGADTVDALNQLYADLQDTKQFFYTPSRSKVVSAVSAEERFARVVKNG